MPNHVDPRRRCLALEAWPDADRAAWQTAMRAATGRFSRRGPAARLAHESREKASEGYGRWLGFLAHRGWLDASVGPLARVTPDRAVAFFDELSELGNRGYTIAGRFQELQMALRIMVPGAEVGWLTRPNGIPLRQLLHLETRSIPVHHSAVLYGWGLEVMSKAVALRGARRRQVMLRDGLLIALLAAAGPRLRSVHEMRLGVQIRFDLSEWWMALDGPDTKTDTPHLVPLPGSLTPWIQRYIEHERVELLAGAMNDAMWINWGGAALGVAGIDKRIRWHSTKRFGLGQAFGVHRFRHCIGTTAPLMVPDAAGIGAAILGTTGRAHEKHYDRGRQAAAAEEFLTGLELDREEARTILRRLAARSEVCDAPDDPSSEVE